LKSWRVNEKGTDMKNNKGYSFLRVLDKIGLYILSLWVLFLSIIVLKSDLKIISDTNITLWKVIGANLVPLICLIFGVLGIMYYFCFDYKFKGTIQLQIKAEEVKNKNYEHLTFLVTYIIPLLSLSYNGLRYCIVLLILLIFIGALYVKTNLFYMNPSLALLGFHLYEVNGYCLIEGEKKEYKNLIVISKKIIIVNNDIELLQLDDEIYYGRPNG